MRVGTYSALGDVVERVAALGGGQGGGSEEREGKLHFGCEVGCVLGIDATKRVGGMMIFDDGVW